MVIAYSFVGICCSAASIVLIWSFSPLIAILSAPFVGSAAVVLAALWACYGEAEYVNPLGRSAGHSRRAGAWER